VHDLAKPPEIFKSTPEISTISPSSLGLLVADIHGSVHVLNEEFTTVIVWIAHVNGRVTHMAERKGILITLGVCSADPFLFVLISILIIGRR
jgi:vacuolar protein sorting-associated protein 11